MKGIKVSVDIKDDSLKVAPVFGKLEPKTTNLIVTENGEYTPPDGVDGFSKVIAEFDTRSLPKVKVTSFSVTNDCINKEGRWEGDVLIDTSETSSINLSYCDKLNYIDTRHWDLRKLTNMQEVFREVGNIYVDGIEEWNTSALTTLNLAFFHVTYDSDILDLTKWNTSSLEKLQQCFSYFYVNYLNLEGWDTSKVTDFRSTFYSIQKKIIINVVGWDFSAVTSSNMVVRVFTPNYHIESIVGYYTEDEVVQNNIQTCIGLKVSLSLKNEWFGESKLNRASLRAIINGIADLTGQTTQILSLDGTSIAKLTEEDIAIATSKNWTIA